jgi:hypothetical protein
VHANGLTLRQPLSDDEFTTLADSLGELSPFDTDGLYGVLHAVAVAPSPLPPSAWLSLVAPNGVGADPVSSQSFLGLMLRMHNEVLDAVKLGRVIFPEPDDFDACESVRDGLRRGKSILSGSTTTIPRGQLGRQAHATVLCPDAGGRRSLRLHDPFTHQRRMRWARPRLISMMVSRPTPVSRSAKR